MRAIGGEPLIHEAYNELHHYTGLAGLRGIIQSNALWATRYDHLNDSTEVHHFKDFAIESLANRIREHLKVKKRSSLQIERWISQNGGIPIVAQSGARAFIEANYEVALKGGTSGVPFAVPFFVSFCGHAIESYERENGLLSQWRSYGDVLERFAIVFDARHLTDLIAKEHEQFHYSHLQIADVIYNDRRLIFSERFRDLMDLLVPGWWAQTNSKPHDMPKELITHLMTAMFRFKHEGFREEQEVRIVAAPMSDALLAKFRREAPEPLQPEKNLKTVVSTSRGDRLIPTLVLLGQPGQRLPILRVIVGPSRQQDRVVALAREILPNHITLSKSATPFVG